MVIPALARSAGQAAEDPPTIVAPKAAPVDGRTAVPLGTSDPALHATGRHDGGMKEAPSHDATTSVMASADAFAGGGATTVRVIWAMQACMLTVPKRTIERAPHSSPPTFAAAR